LVDTGRYRYRYLKNKKIPIPVTEHTAYRDTQYYRDNYRLFRTKFKTLSKYIDVVLEAASSSRLEAVFQPISLSRHSRPQLLHLHCICLESSSSVSSERRESRRSRIASACYYLTSNLNVSAHCSSI